MKRRGWVLLVLATAAPPAAAQDVPRSTLPRQYEQRKPPRTRLPLYAGGGIAAGRQWYQCPVCGGSNDAVTFSGRAGIRVADGRALIGGEGSLFLNGPERMGFLLASGNLLVGKHVMVGGGFGLAGFRVPMIYSDYYHTLTAGDWSTMWGLGADLHAELLLPVSEALSLAPRVSYSRTTNHPLDYMLVTGNSGQSGHGDLALLQLGMSILWRGKPTH